MLNFHLLHLNVLNVSNVELSLASFERLLNVELSLASFEPFSNVEFYFDGLKFLNVELLYFAAM